MNIDSFTDHDLWKALKQGDRRAFAELYQRHYRPLYGYGYKLVPQASLVEDAIQDLFVDLWRMRQNLSDADSVKFYLFRSLRRALYRLSETEKRLISVSENQLAEQPVSEWAEREQETQLRHRLMHLLQYLPERQLEAITLRFYENFKTNEIAGIMGITEKSVRNTLHKALVHLREHAHYLAPFLGLLLVWLSA